jgi:uncharacterized protein (DUF302 family)
MLIVVESQRSVAQVQQAFAEICAKYKFGVLGCYDLRQKMEDKGVPFDRDCLVFEVCNPQQAKKVLERNITIAIALPCRVAVYQEDGKTKLATIKPTALLSTFPNPELQPVAVEVEQTLSQIMHELE